MLYVRDVFEYASGWTGSMGVRLHFEILAKLLLLQGEMTGHAV